MHMRTMLALATAAVMTASGTAMAASKIHRGNSAHWSGGVYGSYAQAPGGIYSDGVYSSGIYSGDIDDSYAQVPNAYYGEESFAYSGNRPWGTSTGTASQPGYNSALDRAKGHLD